MIKIRYADLPHGLHARVHTAGRRTVIYLLPGLSAVQRRDALGRLIRASRQGYGPRLRTPEVRFAVARDVAKTTTRNGLAAVRCHPAGSVALAALIAAGVLCYAFFVTVTVRFTREPGRAPRRRRLPGPARPRGPVPGPRRPRAGGHPAGRPRRPHRGCGGARGRCGGGDRTCQRPAGTGGQPHAAAHRHLVRPRGGPAVRLGRAVIAAAVRHAVAGPVPGQPRPRAARPG